jgi:hypothetical protein
MISHQLVGDYQEAVNVHDAMQSCVKTDGASAVEQSQIRMHVIKLCRQAGKEEEALERLDQGVRDGVISARGEVTEIRGECVLGQRFRGE